MAVLLVILTFAIFIVIDFAMSRKRVQVAAASAEPQLSDEAVPETEVVNGFYIPSNVQYHAGHTWLLRERKNMHRVGVDDFAAALSAGVERVELPKPGHWIRQGQKVIALFRGSEKVEMVSPVEGEVVEVNPDIAKDPSLLRDEPYGRGWLMTVFAPDEDSPRRNLLPANIVPAWMREASDRLFQLQPQLAGVTAADGGEPLRHPEALLDLETWKVAAQEFFLP
jgi:glycine cleavage system H protein